MIRFRSTTIFVICFVGCSQIIIATGAASAKQTPSVTWKSETLKKTSGKISIEVNYPQFSDSAGKPLSAANSAMRKTISNAVGGLIKNLTDLGPDAVADIDGNFEICLGNKNVISLREIMHTYQRGAAHPDNYSTSFNFQMNPPAVLTLKSIFGSGSGYLKTLSRICADQLLQDAKGGYVDKEQVRRACAPVTDNFRNFVIQEKSLQIDFSEDQIGSHAEGAPTISIPYSKIKSRLNPSSVVYKLATSAQ